MATLNVGNQSQLSTALRNAKSGDTILLAPDATFSMLQIYRNKFDGPVTIASADKGRPATIQEMHINGTANLTIDGVRFDHVGGKGGKPFMLEQSQNVTIKNSVFDGVKDGAGHGSGFGLIAKLSSDVTLQDNVVKTFNNGFSFFDMKNLTVRGNEVEGIRNDGMTFAGIKTGLIENNDFHSFRSPNPSSLHKDSIQFWTINSTGSEKVIIRGNTFESSDGRQTIFMGNDHARVLNGSQPYKDILIENNVIKANHGHGISIEHVDGAVIRGNVLSSTHGPDATVPVGLMPLINVTKSSANVLVSGNKTASLQKVDGHNFKYEGNTLTTNKQFWHWTDSTNVAPIKSGPSATFQAWAGGSAVGSASEARGEPAPSPQPEAPVGPAVPVEEAAAPAATPKVAEHFRFSGESHGSGRKVEFKSLDFTASDTVTLGEYDQGTFQHKEGGNHVRAHWDGSFVKIDSIVDIAELAHVSKAVSARVEGRDLVLSVGQGRGLDEFTFRGLGDAFGQANNPDLF